MMSDTAIFQFVPIATPHAVNLAGGLPYFCFVHTDQMETIFPESTHCAFVSERGNSASSPSLEAVTMGRISHSVQSTQFAPGAMIAGRGNR